MLFDLKQWHNWKYAPHLYHTCWWMIFALLAYFALTLPQFALSFLPLLRPWPLVALALLVCCVTLVHLYSLRLERRIKAKNELIVEQAYALQKAEAKIDYLLRIIHDMRSPLTSILNALPRLEQASDFSGYVQGIKSACNQAIALSAKVLKVAAATKGKLEELHPEPILLSAWLKEIAAICRPSAEQKRISVAIDISSELPEYILADRGLMTRMLLNLVDNAVHYSGSGRQVKIRCIPDNLNDLPFFTIEVVNETPVTVPEDVFEPYKRGKENKAGTGLGLAITKRLAELMGGSAYVVNITEAGLAAFSIQLPLKAANPMAAHRYPAQEAPVVVDTKGKGLQVMLVDDDDNLRPLLSEYLLGNANITKVISAGSGRQALRHAPILMPDVIITDDQLEDMSGVHLIEQLRGQERTAGIPVMVITGGDLHPIVRKAYEVLGVTEFLSKPFNIGGLARAIVRATSA